MPDGFYQVPRFEIPEMLWEAAFDRRDPAGNLDMWLSSGSAHFWNLSQRTPEHFARFERLFEILSTDESDLAAGRERYKQYQQRGYPMTHFVAEKT